MSDTLDTKPKRSRKPAVGKPRSRGAAARPKPAKDAQAEPKATAPAAAVVPTAPTWNPLFKLELPVRWRDLDAFNHVNNASFLTYLEEARLAWLESLPGPWLTDRIAPVLAALQINYRRPIPWPESVRVELAAERVGSSSLTLAHRIQAAADAKVLYADGHAVMVWVDATSGRAASLPEAVRQAAETVPVVAPA